MENNYGIKHIKKLLCVKNTVKNIDNSTNIDDINADFLLSLDIKLIIIPNIKELNDISIK